MGRLRDRRTAALAAGLAAALAVGALALHGGGSGAKAGARTPGQLVASGIGHPTNIAFDGRGGLWVTSAGAAREASDGVWYVPSVGGRPVHVVEGLNTPLGLAWHRGELYVSHISPAGKSGLVVAYSRFDGTRFERRRVVLDGLPVGRHTVDSIVAGPGDRLYLGIGSESDHRPTRHRLSGTVVSFHRDGSGLLVEARGLRNPYGLAFVPGTDDLLVSDNGRDDLGLRRPPDELNLVGVRGPARGFGFPECYGQGGRACRGTAAPLARLAPHAAAGAVAVVRRFGRYGLSAFVAQNGSSFARNPTGSNVVRVRLVRRGRGYRARVLRFADDFRAHDPLAVAVGPRGRLYVGLYRSGRVVRLAPR